jgi:hypothetical protein
MSCGQGASLVYNISECRVVQLRLDLIGQIKRNWMKRRSVAILLDTWNGHGSISFIILLIKLSRQI